MDITTEMMTSIDYMKSLYSDFNDRRADQTMYYIEGILSCFWILGHLTSSELNKLKTQNKKLYSKYHPKKEE